MKKPLAICLGISLILALLAVGCQKTSQPTEAISKNPILTEEEYMKKNSVSIEPDKLDDAAISILNPVTENAEVILTGEGHNVAINIELRMAFLKYFYKYAGVRYYLIEAGYSEGVLLNKYLKNGDEEILHKLFSNPTGSYPRSKEEFEHYKELYMYNKSLPENGKITVIGIDLENQRPPAIFCLNYLLPDKKAPSEIEPIIQELKNTYENGKYDRDELHKFSAKLKENINANRDIYQEYLKGDLFDFEFVNDNILNKLDSYTQEGMLVNREKNIYENFKKAYAHLPKGKYFGEFGLLHIAQKKTKDAEWEWLGTNLNKADSPVKGKVVSIAYLYDKSYFRFNDNSVLSASNYIKNDFIESAVKSDLTLLRLDGEQSPFKKKLIFPFIEAKADGGVTADYYQYFLFIKNAEAVSMYSKPS